MLSTKSYVKYSEKLANKKQIVALNKIDMVFDDTTIPDNKKYFEDKGYEVFLINALSGEGLPELMERAYYYVETTNQSLKRLMIQLFMKRNKM